MKRLFFGVAVALGLLIAANQPAAAVNTDDFTIRSFTADYYLNKDSEGRSTLKTVEKITAVFPSFDQNHGLERAIPEAYDGHSTTLAIQSVTDENGADLPYSTSGSNDTTVLRIGDADSYVHGVKQYIITYTQRDVTRFFADTNTDEFYWDVNGTQWPQAMEAVKATVHIPATLSSALTNRATCYQGREGSNKQCSIMQTKTEDGAVRYETTATSLTPYENVTVAIGFTPHTFLPYQQSAAEKFWEGVISTWTKLLFVSSVFAAGLLVWMIVRRYKIMHRIKGRGTVVPEYLPPKNASVLLSGRVLGNVTSDTTAQLIDLAVRHYIKIYQTKEKTFFKAPEYELEIIKDPNSLHAEELKLLQNLFGSTAVGSRFNMKKLQNNQPLARKLLAARKQLHTDSRKKYGMFEYAEKEAKQLKTLGIWVLGIGIVIISPLVIIVGITALGMAKTMWPLTQKGVDLKHYLAGLRYYIGIAEEERLNMLQSPEGAEKVGVKVSKNDTAQLVKLYERALPYAILFGIEKKWAKQLGAYYEAGAPQPDWYSGNVAFNAALFSASLSSFTSQTSSYSSSASSSSGGSSGGGSSGGGGGGGGGGGW